LLRRSGELRLRDAHRQYQPLLPQSSPRSTFATLMKALKERLKGFENNIFYQTSPDTIPGQSF